MMDGDIDSAVRHRRGGAVPDQQAEPLQVVLLYRIGCRLTGEKLEILTGFCRIRSVTT